MLDRGPSYPALLVLAVLRCGTPGIGIAPCAVAAQEQPSAQVRLLQQGETVHGKLTASPARFGIELSGGMFVRLGIIAEAPVLAVLSDPEGRVLTDVRLAPDSEVAISALSGKSGRYAFVIQPGEQGVTEIAYKVVISVVRSAQPDDQTRLRADLLLSKASAAVPPTQNERGLSEVQSLEEARRLYQALDERANSVDVLIRIGRLYHFQEDFAKAAATFEAAITISRKIGDARLEAVALNAASLAYWPQGKGQEATAASHASLKLARALLDPWLEARALVGLGDAQYSTAQLHEALNSYLQAADLWVGLNWKRGEAEALLNIGYTRIDLGEEQKALDALTRAEARWRALGDRSKPAVDPGPG